MAEIPAEVFRATLSLIVRSEPDRESPRNWSVISRIVREKTHSVNSSSIELFAEPLEGH